MEMCCCKTHLHARQSIRALIECREKQGINMESFSDYYSFFDFPTDDCGSEVGTHVPWDCVSDSKKLFIHISSKWENYSQTILNKSDDTITVKLQEFQKTETTTASPWELMDPRTKNDSDKTQDICIPFDPF